MCDLAIARHKVENTDRLGPTYALYAASMKFGPNGEVNFPPSASFFLQKRLAASVALFRSGAVRDQPSLR